MNAHTELTLGRTGRYVRTGVRFVVKAVLPLVILSTAAVAAWSLMETAPKAKRQPPPRMARLIEVEPVRFGTETVTVEAMGTVLAAREITLQARVDGQVDWISENFVPGGLFEKGQRILTLDDTDYALVVKQKEAAVAEVESDLAIERGQQSIAKREYELVGKNRKMTETERDLVLRQPQLASIQATLQTAKAALKQAQLDVQRTVINAPFDAIVQERTVDIGAQIGTSTSIATLIGTEIYWIKVSVPVDQLKWIDIPRADGEAGSTVRIYDESAWGPEVYRTGAVIRMTGGLETEGRMAQLLVAIDDPLAQLPEHVGQPVLLIGSYVRAEIEGVRIGPAAILDRQLIRDQNTVWLLDDENNLRIQQVRIAYRGVDRVVIDDGLAEGQQVVKTDLSAPVSGMPLRVQKEAASNAARQGGGARP